MLFGTLTAILVGRGVPVVTLVHFTSSITVLPLTPFSHEVDDSLVSLLLDTAKSLESWQDVFRTEPSPCEKIGTLASVVHELGNLVLSHANLAVAFDFGDIFDAALDVSAHVGEVADENAKFLNFNLVLVNLNFSVLELSDEALEFHIFFINVSLEDLVIVFGSLYSSHQLIDDDFLGLNFDDMDIDFSFEHHLLVLVGSDLSVKFHQNMGVVDQFVVSNHLLVESDTESLISFPADLGSVVEVHVGGLVTLETVSELLDFLSNFRVHAFSGNSFKRSNLNCEPLVVVLLNSDKEFLTGSLVVLSPGLLNGTDFLIEVLSGMSGLLHVVVVLINTSFEDTDLDQSVLFVEQVLFGLETSNTGGVFGILSLDETEFGKDVKALSLEVLDFVRSSGIASIIRHAHLVVSCLEVFSH